MNDFLRQAMTRLFGEGQYTVTKGGTYEHSKPGIIGKIGSFLGGYKAPKGGEIDTTPAPTEMPTSVPAPATVTEQYAQPNTQGVEEQMRKVLTQYGGEDLPALEYIPLFLKAMEMYPMFAQNPYLLPQMSILESSGGRNITRPNNPLNWGARLQAEGLFQPQSVEEAIMKAITGIGERFDYYEPFRQDRPLTPEEIEAFAQVYEPQNLDYGRSLLEGIKHFENFGR